MTTLFDVPYRFERSIFEAVEAQLSCHRSIAAGAIARTIAGAISEMWISLNLVIPCLGQVPVRALGMRGFLVESFRENVFLAEIKPENSTRNSVNRYQITTIGLVLVESTQPGSTYSSVSRGRRMY